MLSPLSPGTRNANTRALSHMHQPQMQTGANATPGGGLLQVEGPRNAHRRGSLRKNTRSFEGVPLPSKKLSPFPTIFANKQT